MCHRRAIKQVQTTQGTTRWTDRWELERFRGVVLFFRPSCQVSFMRAPVRTNSRQQNKYMRGRNAAPQSLLEAQKNSHTPSSPGTCFFGCNRVYVTPDSSPASTHH